MNVRNILGKANLVVQNIDQYLNNLEKAAMELYLAVRDYFNGADAVFEERRRNIEKLESRNDELKRLIKLSIYREMLIPESRGDVLSLLEMLDNVIDCSEKIAVDLSIEKPYRWPFLVDDYIALAEAAMKTVQELVVSARVFFSDYQRVSEHITRVHFWEHESDKIEERLKRAAFESDAIEKFSMKVHVRYITEKIASLADMAEDAGENLEVFAIKRSI